VPIEHAGGTADGQLGTDERRIRDAIRRADTGGGVAVLGDLGSAILLIRHVFESRAQWPRQVDRRADRRRRWRRGRERIGR
jgi:dihydroxyacetone kinase DhaKLM complex PTS-EIIA-like component DhaM